MTVFLITGSAGFIGYHLTEKLLRSGQKVIGVDGMTDYYDVNLKRARNNNLKCHSNYQFHEGMIEDEDFLKKIFCDHKPEVVIHLAAQAGVRYSIDNPKSYVDTNLVGTFNILEACRHHQIQHLLMASTSSVYGANKSLPFKETQKCDMPMSFYAATKKANEAMSHSYSHLFQIPITVFRFFTVYGPWGRPDMALFKFAKAMRAGEPIDIYNNGNMKRDFTYVGDLVEAISKLSRVPPLEKIIPPDLDSKSEIAPWRVVNIGNSSAVNLMDFIEALEVELSIEAKKNYLGMQQGDVEATWADTQLLQRLTGFVPNTPVSEGIAQFTNWFINYYSSGE